MSKLLVEPIGAQYERRHRLGRGSATGLFEAHIKPVLTTKSGSCRVLGDGLFS